MAFTLQDVVVGQLSFSALQTNNNSGGILIAPDDGVIDELGINVTSGTMTAVNTFDVTVNGDAEVAEVFSIPVTAADASAISKASNGPAVKKGDRIEVQSGGNTGGTVLALGYLKIRR